jgi:hypothetical protein
MFSKLKKSEIISFVITEEHIQSKVTTQKSCEMQLFEIWLPGRYLYPKKNKLAFLTKYAPFSNIYY